MNQPVKPVDAPEEWTLDVLGVPYGGPFGGKDAQGEYFTPQTDLWLERITRRPVVYYHGLAEGGAAPQVIGEEVGWERRADGVWFRVVLDQANALARRVWEAARKGLARASSGAISHLVRVAGDGRILVWPVGELSLLDARQHAPANPYAVALVHAKATFAAAGLSGVETFEVETPPPDAGASTNNTPAGSDVQTVPVGDEREYQEDESMDEQTIRNIVRQEFGSAFEARFGEADAGPEAMFLTRQTPAVVGQRGEPLLTANGTPFVDAVKAMRQGRFDVVRFQLAGKALAEGTDSAGGYLVPVEYSNKLIEMLRARTAVRAAGATVIPMASDTLQIPSQTGGATAYWVAENAQITASDQTWGQVQLQAKKLAALTKLSSELFEDSDPQVEALVMADLARVLALEEDIKYLRGDGEDNTPEGLENITGVNVDTTTLGANGGTPSFDNLVDMLYALDADNVPADGRAWIVHPRTVNTLRQIKDSNNKYLWADPSAPGDPPTLWGYPVFTTTAIPIDETQGTSTDCSTVYLGCWPELVIGQRKALELRASDAAGNAFEYDQVFIRAIMRVDANVRHADSFEVLKGVRP
jgi:HK97 family phage major capsid protein